MSLLKIGALAKQTGLSVQSIRYYEKLGLITAQQTLPSGYRLFAPSTGEQINFIRRCQGIGFSLHEIAQILALRQDPDASAAQVKAKIEGKIDLVQHKINDLLALKQNLEQLSASCSGTGPLNQCPIYDALWGSNTTL